jgi:hypothetical protein
MDTQAFAGERVTLTTSRKFVDVVAEIDRAVSHPNVPELFRRMKDAGTPDELERAVEAAVGPQGIMEFLRFDFGLPLRLDHHPTNRNALRLMLGNPLIMREMVRGTPDAGSYAPVSVLVDERDGRVHISYDRMASLLAPVGDPHALKVAQALDAKIERLLEAAAGETAR